MYSKNVILVYFLLAFACTCVRGILKGDEAQPGQFPYVVAIFVRNSNICSGGVIGDKWILSAASCVTDASDNFMYNIKFEVYASALTTGLNTNITIPLKTVYIPQDYDSRTKRSDIAVMKLTRSLDFKGFQQLCIPSGNHNFYEVGVQAKVMGSGVHFADQNGLWYSDLKLRFADVQIVNNSEFAKLHNIPDKLDKHNFLAKMTKQSDEAYGVCERDYGSPLVYKSAMILGVFIESANDECDEREQPAIYMKVAPYLDFIRNAVKGVSTGIRVHHFD